jgi:small subunit ribosomal protein S21
MSRRAGFPASVESSQSLPKQAGGGGRHGRSRFFQEFTATEVFVVKLRLRERESIQEAVRRFRKLVEHSGIKKEMRRREFYEKPSDKRRRARRRAERRARMARMPITATARPVR